jgi:hypothetical protein
MEKLAEPKRGSMTKKGYKDLLAEAEAMVEAVDVTEAARLHGRDNVVFVDLRDPREREREGTIAEAFSCPRGMLEFWIDPESPYHKSVFAKTSSSSSTALAAGAPHSPRKPPWRWGLKMSAIWKAASPPGGIKGCLWNRWWRRRRGEHCHYPGWPRRQPLDPRVKHPCKV